MAVLSYRVQYRQIVCGRPEKISMRDPFRTARLSRLIVAFCLMTTSAAAQSQVTQPVMDRDTVANRSADSPPENKSPKTQATEDSPSVRKKGSFGDRLRDSVWPFGTKQQSTDSGCPPRTASVGRDGRIASGKDGSEAVKSQVPDWKRLTSPAAEEKRGRWLAGRYVRYAPGHEAGDTEAPDVASDASLSIAGYESIPEPRRSTALPESSSGVVQAVASMPDRVGDAQDPRELPTAIDPLPFPTPNSPDQPETSETFGSMIEPLVAQPATENEREPYGLGKRFLRGYPRLV